MTFNEYQKKAHITSSTTSSIEMCVLGLCGESGEVADIVKKHKYHGHILPDGKLYEELGDVLWYIAEMATTLGVLLEDIVLMNIRKLQKRYPEGFSSERSINRVRILEAELPKEKQC